MMSLFLFILPLATGVLQGLAFAPHDIWPLVLLVPVFQFAFVRRVKNLKWVVVGWAIYAITFGFVSYSWIGPTLRFFSQTSMLRSVFLEFLFFGLVNLSVLFTLVSFYFVHKNRRWRFLEIPAFALLYGFFEQLLFPVQIFPSRLGNVLAPWSEISQLASIGGTTLITVFIAVVGLCFFSAFAEARHRGWRFGLPLVIVLAAHLWGHSRLEKIKASKYENLKVGWVQPNIGIEERKSVLRNERPAIERVDHLIQTETAKLTAEGAALVVWPENFLPRVVRHAGDVIPSTAFTNTKSKTEILVGFFEVQKNELFGSAVVLNGQADYSSNLIYRKNVLVPFGEYIPFAESFPLLLNFKSIPEPVTAGTKVLPLQALGGRVNVGVSICYEILFTEHARRLVLNKSDFIANISNDAWFGPSAEPYQHFEISRMIAVETGRSVLRVSNSGLSALTLPTGEVKSLTAIDTFADGVVEVPIYQDVNELTPYVRFGYAWLYWAVGVLTLGLGLDLFFRRGDSRSN